MISKLIRIASCVQGAVDISLSLWQTLESLGKALTLSAAANGALFTLRQSPQVAVDVGNEASLMSLELTQLITTNSCDAVALVDSDQATLCCRILLGLLMGAELQQDIASKISASGELT